MARLHRGHRVTIGPLMHSLLERLRRRLRELGQPTRSASTAEPALHPSHPEVGEATVRRTELEPAGSRHASAQDKNRMPPQPPPPASTREKAAVFSKRRQPVPHRQPGTIWGTTSFLEVGMGATGDDRADRARLTLFKTEPGGVAVEGSVSDVTSWPMRPPPPTTNTGATGTDSAVQPWWTPEQALTQANALDLPVAPLDGATPLDGCPSLVQHSELTPPVAETSSFDLQAGAAQLQVAFWRVD